jgi:thiol-disulfide isomerase/thioredoxin
MSVNAMEFAEFEKVSRKTGSHLDFLAPQIGKVYVISITRDGCSACVKQKPRVDRLARELAEKKGKKVVFTRVHVKYSTSDDSESLRSKGVFGHYFYPTNLILLRTRDRGAIELYRNVSPSISELRKNVRTATEIAAMFEKERK